TYGVGPKDRATHLAGSAFDASVWEIWPYLAAGAALYMPDEETRLTPERLRAWLAEMGITICFLPTPLAEALLDEEWPEEIALQALLTGGDKLTRRPASTLPFQLVNHYGPTENTVVTTCVPVAPQGAGQSTPPPIGRPIANTQVYLLDGELNLVPIGVPGELYIGGAGLARGYLNRPDLTAERFIPNPFSERGGEVLYRTGDLGRYLPDGNIAFLGRIDEQVKIRGYRIELGEIEAVLARHPAVKESIVVVREMGGKLLCAYVVPRPEAEVTEEALLEHLGRFLPDYMLPHAILFLDRLPLTPNGKVDRAALPAPQYTQRAETHVAPRTEREEILARIFGEVLNLSSVGIYDNFFRLGGDSILAIQIVSRARQAGLQLTPTQIFQHQTIAELAVAATPARAVAAEQGPVVGEAPLTPIQHWFFAQDAAGRNHFNQAVLLELSGPFEAASLREALCAVVAHHDALRSRFFQDASGGWRQRFEPPGGEIPFIVEDLCAFEDADLLSREIEARAAAAQERLDPVVGPLLRAHLFEPGGGRPRRLLIVIHHLAIDAVSWRILLEDLLLAHEQIVRGKPVRLPP
ncbi:MAG: non-ribosomal peptide synthetase, partial [Deltaproteobacteria bacterium]